jgi:hypothetical protein
MPVTCSHTGSLSAPSGPGGPHVSHIILASEVVQPAPDSDSEGGPRCGYLPCIAQRAAQLAHNLNARAGRHDLTRRRLSGSRGGGPGSPRRPTRRTLPQRARCIAARPSGCIAPGRRTATRTDGTNFTLVQTPSRTARATVTVGPNSISYSYLLHVLPLLPVVIPTMQSLLKILSTSDPQT